MSFSDKMEVSNGYDWLYSMVQTKKEIDLFNKGGLNQLTQTTRVPINQVAT